MCNHNCACSNNTLFLLILLMAIGGKKICIDEIFNGCTTPFLLALAYCMGKNGTLNKLFGGTFGDGCNCSCRCD